MVVLSLNLNNEVKNLRYNTSWANLIPEKYYAIVTTPNWPVMNIFEFLIYVFKYKHTCTDNYQKIQASTIKYQQVPESTNKYWQIPTCTSKCKYKYKQVQVQVQVQASMLKHLHLRTSDIWHFSCRPSDHLADNFTRGKWKNPCVTNLRFWQN